MSEHELDARVEQLYDRVGAGLRQDRIITVWVGFEVRAATDDEAMALVAHQVQTGRDRGATLRELRIDPPRWEAPSVIPREPIETAGEASV